MEDSYDNSGVLNPQNKNNSSPKTSRDNDSKAKPGSAIDHEQVIIVSLNFP
mgnify:CR=1 FL=1